MPALCSFSVNKKKPYYSLQIPRSDLAIPSNVGGSETRHPFNGIEFHDDIRTLIPVLLCQQHCIVYPYLKLFNSRISTGILFAV